MADNYHSNQNRININDKNMPYHNELCFNLDTYVCKEDDMIDHKTIDCYNAGGDDGVYSDVIGDGDDIVENCVGDGGCGVMISDEMADSGCVSDIIINENTPKYSIDYIDPDINLLNDCYPNSCFYQLNDLKSLSCKFRSVPFSIFHLNARSLFNKLNEINMLFLDSNIRFPVLAFTETWLNELTTPLVSMPNYNFVYKNREDRIGGGVCFFIRNDLNFITHDSFFIVSNIFDSLTIEIISNNKEPNILLTVVYRPPNTDLNLFFEYLKSGVIRVPKNKKYYLIGDFNIDLLKTDYNNLSTEFLNFLNIYSLFPLIKTPTRVTEFSRTLIDNIFTNNFSPHISGVIQSDISDHFPIFTLTESFLTKTDHCYLKHNFCKQNLNKLLMYFQSYDWKEVINSVDVDKGFASFNEIFNRALDTFCPVSANQKHKNKHPWFSYGLRKSLKTKIKLYHKFIKQPSLSNKQIYSKYKNIFTKLCREAEITYFNNQFLINQKNSKKTWNLIKQNLNTHKTDSTISLIVNNTLTTDSSLIANKFNDYFNSSFSFNNNPLINLEFKTYLGQPVINSLFLTDSDCYEITQIVNNFKNSISSGTDNISNFLLKKNISGLIIPLTHLVNCSLNSGVFPNCYKISKIIPLFKKGCNHTVDNYRPISLISSISKILKKLLK